LGVTSWGASLSWGFREVRSGIPETGEGGQRWVKAVRCLWARARSSRRAFYVRERLYMKRDKWWFTITSWEPVVARGAGGLGSSWGVYILIRSVGDITFIVNMRVHYK